MGNLRKGNEYKKTQTISIRVTEVQKSKIGKEAKANHMSISDYMVKKTTEKGNVAINREEKRIYRLVKTEEAMQNLLKTMRKFGMNTELSSAVDNLEKEVNLLWHC